MLLYLFLPLDKEREVVSTDGIGVEVFVAVMGELKRLCAQFSFSHL